MADYDVLLDELVQHNHVIGEVTNALPVLDARYLKLDASNDPITGTLLLQNSADAQELIVKAKPSQTANLQEWQNSSGTVLLNTTSEGQLNLNITKNSVVVGDYVGLTFLVRGQPGAVAGSEVLIGITGQAKVNSSYAFSQVIGNRALVVNESSGNISIASAFHGYWNPQGAGGATDAHGFRAQAILSAGYSGTTTRFSNFVADTVTKFGSPTGVFTTVYGYLVNDIVTNTGATNAYGLYINNISGAVTNNYAILTNAGNIVFNEGGDASTDFRVESDTEANMLFLDANADTDGALYFGGTTNGIKINKGGDMTFIGSGSGLAFGGCWGNEIGWTQASAVQNTWYLVSDADMSDGGLNNVTHDGSGKLTAANAGYYLIQYSASLECSLLDKHIQVGPSINGAAPAAGVNHYEISSPAAQVEVSGNAIILLTAGQTVEVAVRTTDTGTPDLSVDHLNITIVQIGA